MLNEETYYFCINGRIQTHLDKKWLGGNRTWYDPFDKGLWRLKQNLITFIAIWLAPIFKVVQPRAWNKRLPRLLDNRFLT